MKIFSGKGLRDAIASPAPGSLIYQTSATRNPSRFEMKITLS